MMVRRLPLEDPSKSYTIVHRVHPNSQADRAGLLPGDVVAATHEEVTKWPQGPRPIAFSIIRKPAGALNKRTRNTSPASSSFTTRGAVSNTTTTTTQTKTPTANNKSSTATTPAAACKIVTNECAFDNKTTTTSQDAQAAIILAHKLASTFVPSKTKNTTNNASTTIQQERKSPSPTASTLPMKKSSSLELANNTPSSKSLSLKTTTAIPTTCTVVPFCRACRNPGATGRAHHALCPQHPQFDNSGAKEKLQLIRRGVEMNCPACLHHYQHGRVASTTVTHVTKCPRRKQPLRQHGQVVLGMVDPVLAPPVHTTSTGGGQENSLPNKSDSVTTEKKTTTTKKKSAKTTTEKKKTTTSTRKKVEASQGSQSVTFASSNHVQPMQDTQDTLASSTAASSLGRRIRKKRRYNYEQPESDSDNDFKEQQTTLLSSQRLSLTRSKFTETGFDVPLVVDTKKETISCFQEKGQKVVTRHQGRQ